MRKYLSIVLSLILVAASIFPFSSTVGLTADTSVCTPTSAPVIRDVTLYAYCENDAYASPQGYNWVSFNVNNIEDVTVYDQSFTGNELFAACLVGDTIYGFTHVGNFVAIDPTDFSYEVIQSGLPHSTTISDMVYDHISDTVYALHSVGIPGTFESTTYLSTVDLTNGALTNVGVCNDINTFDIGGMAMATLSVDSEGAMFAICDDGHLYEVDKETAHTTEKFDLGMTLFANQSATIDLETNTMYWHHYDSLTNNGLYAVNPYSGEKVFLGQIRNGGQYYGLVIMPDEEDIPDAPVIGDITLYAYCENDAYADSQGYNYVSFNVNSIEDVTVYDQSFAGNELFAACLVDDTIYGYTHVGNFIAIDPTDFSYEVLQSGLTYATRISDMVYDHTTDTVYLLHSDTIPGTTERTTFLCTVDLTYGAIETVGVCNNINEVNLGGIAMATLSVDSEGAMFAIGKDGHLYEVDKETGHTTEKFDLGMTLFANQSAIIDLETNTMYWHHYNSLTDNGLYAVNPYSGEKVFLGQIRNGGQYYGLVIMQDVPQPGPGEYDMGDVNMDGSVTATDALLVLRHAMEISELSSEAQELADITGDGSINAMDALSILRIAMG